MSEKELIYATQKSVGDSSEDSKYFFYHNFLNFFLNLIFLLYFWNQTCVLDSTGSVEVENEIVDLDEAREHCGNFKIPDRTEELQETARQPLQSKETNKKRVETKEMESQANRTFLSDYYQDVEGNMYHKDQCTAKFIKEKNLIDSMYLYNKYVLNKQTKAEANFTTDEDTTLKNGKFYVY